MKKEIGFGTYQMTKELTEESVKTAVDAGYDFIDTAFKYDNESLVSAGIKSSKNPNIRVQTKIWIVDYDNVEKAFFNQLELLGVTKVWSVLLHRPTFNFYESVKAWLILIDLKKRGLVEKIGVSNFDKDMIRILVRETGVWPEINQIELSVTNFRDDRVFFAKQHNIQVQAWTPLGVSAMQNLVVNELAKKYKVSAANICVAFLLEQGIVPLVKSENQSRILENLKAKDVVFSKEDMQLLKEQNIYENKASETFYFK